MNAAAFQGGAILGPVAAGFLLEHDLAVPYMAADGRSAASSSA